MSNELKRIMVVEDEPDIREIAKMALADLGGFEVTVCESGQQAIEKLSKARPQLIVLDAMMPEMDGPATFEKIKQMTSGIKLPVVFMTARVQPHEVQGYKDQGAIGVISKPFNPTTLASEINDLWNKT